MNKNSAIKCKGVSPWLLWLSLALSCNLQAQVVTHQGQTASGAYYHIAVPSGWLPEDGLVIWNHGYQGYADAGLEPLPSLGPLRDEVLAGGYALAASSYSQTGWAVFASHIDNRQLYDTFIGLVARPEFVMLQGASLGGLVTVRDIESGLIPDIAAALLVCGATAGSQNWYNALDLRLIYDAVCSNVDGAELPNRDWWEIPGLLSGELQFLRSLERCTGLLSQSLVDTPLVSLLQTDAQRQRLEKILTLSGTDLAFLPLVLGYAVFELPRLIQDPGKLNGTMALANTGVDYGDAAVNQAVTRQAALPRDRQQLEANYTPTGAIGSTRILSIHTSGDGLVPLANQHYFSRLVPDQQITTAVVVEQEPSHCGFTEAEGLAAWQLLQAWTDGGTQPGVADLQAHCLALGGDAGDCRYQPQFNVSGNPVLFPRDNRPAGPGNYVFDQVTGVLAIDGLQVLGEDTLYSLELQQVPAAVPQFEVVTQGEAGEESRWLPLARYFPDNRLLYLPGVTLAPAAAGNNHFDVYLEYSYDGSRSLLQLLDFEVAP